MKGNEKKKRRKSKRWKTRAGSAGTVAAKAGWLDCAGARVFTLSPC